MVPAGEAASRPDLSGVDFAATVGLLSTAIVVTDLSGHLLYANRRAEETFGWTGQALVGSRIADISGVEVSDATATEIANALREHRSWEGEFELRRRDGTVVAVSVTDSGLYGSDGSLIGVVSCVTDVTENRQSIERLVSEAQALRFLLDASTIVSSATSFNECLSRLTSLAVPLLGDLCFVDIIADGDVRRPIVVHADPAKAELAGRLTEYAPRISGPGPTAQVLRTGLGLMMADIDDAALRQSSIDDEHYRLCKEIGFSSCMCVPLKVRGRITGALTLVSAGSGRRFARQDLALMEDLAGRVAHVVDNARALSDQARVARSLQATLLPRTLPEVPGLRLTAAYRAAGEGLVVGGDFYDVFPVARRSWAIAIGDVSGRGADAAAVTGLVRNTLHAAGPHHRDPAALLTAAGLALYDDDTSPERFCTAACVVWQPRRPGRITHASAAHPDVVILRPDGRIDRLGPTGLPLGLFAESHTRSTGCDVGPGDLMVLYTDGITEARDAAGHQYGDDGIAAALRDCAGATADDVVEALLTGVGRHSADELGDDLAVLVVGWLPPVE